MEKQHIPKLTSEIYIARNSVGGSLIGCRICGISVNARNAVDELRFMQEHREHLAPIDAIMERYGIYCSDIDERELPSRQTPW